MNRRDFIKTTTMAAGAATAALSGLSPLSASEVPQENVVSFAEDSPRHKLFPVQRVILKALYGIPLDNKELFRVGAREDVVDGASALTYHHMTEATYLRWLYDQGRSNIWEVTPGHEFQQAVFPWGRRGGKKHLLSVIAAWETHKLLSKPNPQEHYGIAQGDEIKICVVDLSRDRAEDFQGTLARLYERDSFQERKANQTNAYTRFQTDHDIETRGRYPDCEGLDHLTSTVKSCVHSCVSKGLRGAGNIAVILREVDHYHAGHGREVYLATAPSTAAFQGDGKVIMASSPVHGRDPDKWWFRKKFHQAFKTPTRTLALQIPTWEMNPTIPHETMRWFYEEDPILFESEYGARFISEGR